MSRCTIRPDCMPTHRQLCKSGRSSNEPGIAVYGFGRENNTEWQCRRLAICTSLLWIYFAFLITAGYMTYKQCNVRSISKANLMLSGLARWVPSDVYISKIVSSDCCGYYSPFDEATVLQTCYARTVLPGCNAVYLGFQKRVLKLWYAIVFSLVLLHVVIMVIGLLCSNHVTDRFGKGMIPKAYQLSMASTAVIMGQVCEVRTLGGSFLFYSAGCLVLVANSELAERYGAGFAMDIITRSQSSVGSNSVPSTPVASGFLTGGSSVVRRSVAATGTRV